ncbi:MAG: RimK family alpha-L-glutamate ligase [Candidatus Moranbacteria bacterium]|nr:RimK family alpha-L-glutamate ligase [Candidatus Moranbacteria bacterium]
MRLKIGLIHTGIREDERMIIQQAKEINNLELDPIDLRKTVLAFEHRKHYQKYHLILQRCMAGNKADQALWYFQEIGLTVVNDLRLSFLCKNKFATSLRLAQTNIPTPKFATAFTEESVTRAIQKLDGFPIIIKPIAGTSWGRLMGKINDQDSLEMILEHKNALGVNHQAFYLQKYIEKPQRDIRAYLIKDQIVCAVYREASHWITNTARGSKLKSCPITQEMRKLGRQIYHAFGHGLMAIDFFETQTGLTVNEINHTMEFKNVVKETKVNLAKLILEYCVEKIQASKQ